MKHQPLTASCGAEESPGATRIGDNSSQTIVLGILLWLLLLSGGAGIILLARGSDSSGLGVHILFFTICGGVPLLMGLGVIMLVRDRIKLGRSFLLIESPLLIGAKCRGCIEIEHVFKKLKEIRIQIACDKVYGGAKREIRRSLWRKEISVPAGQIVCSNSCTTIPFEISIPSTCQATKHAGWFTPAIEWSVEVSSLPKFFHRTSDLKVVSEK